MQFFSPLNPVLVYIEYNEDGRPSGEADVDFASHAEAQQAMHKHKALMGRSFLTLLNTCLSTGALFFIWQTCFLGAI